MGVQARGLMSISIFICTRLQARLSRQGMHTSAQSKQCVLCYSLWGELAAIWLLLLRKQPGHSMCTPATNPAHIQQQSPTMPLHCHAANTAKMTEVSCKRHAAKVSAGTSCILVKAVAAEETANTCKHVPRWWAGARNAPSRQE